MEKENVDFLHKFNVKAHEKDTLRKQITEVEHLIRLLKHEIESTNVDNRRVQIIAEKEDEIIAKKIQEEKRIVKLVADDIKDQIRHTEEQFNIAENTQNK